MTLLLIGLVPLIVVVAVWAWRHQYRMLCITGTGAARVAGRPGVAADVQLTLVLVDGSSVLVGFRPAGSTGNPMVNLAHPAAPSRSNHQSLLLALDTDAQANLARLRRWEASCVPIVMWLDRDGGTVELSHLRTGQQIALPVIPQPVAVATPDR